MAMKILLTTLVCCLLVVTTGCSKKPFNPFEKIDLPSADLKKFSPFGSSASNPQANLPAPPRNPPPAPERFRVKFSTTKGDFVAEVNRSWSPQGVDRFYNMVNIGYFDDIVIFHPLNQEEIRKIVSLQLDELADRLLANGLVLSVSEEAISEVASVGYDPTYGARPLKRVIQREIQNPLATSLLKHDYAEGSTVHVDFDGNKFTFSDSAAALTTSPT